MYSISLLSGYMEINAETQWTMAKIVELSSQQFNTHRIRGLEKITSSAIQFETKQYNEKQKNLSLKSPFAKRSMQRVRNKQQDK